MNALRNVPLPSWLGLVAVLGSGALLGAALWYQHVGGLAPCELCYWQRYPHMAAIAVGLAAAVSFAWPRLALAFAAAAIAALIVTAGLGVFHVGVEHQWWQGPQACSGAIPRGLSPEELKKYLFNARMVRCDQPTRMLFDISMAGWNAILSGLLALVLTLGVASWIRERK